VVNQILNTRARLMELERKIREQEELEERLEALEHVLKGRSSTA
jgi:predicted component of type VI protein secretion system